MSLASNALTTLATALDELGLTSDGGAQDDRVTRYINAASALFQRGAMRGFHREVDYAERVGASGSDRLLIGAFLPLVSVSSVALEGSDGSSSVVPSAEYVVEDAEAGFLRHLVGGWADTRIRRASLAPIATGDSRALYTVTYTGGYITPQQAADGMGTRTLPYDIEDAVLQYVAMRNHQRGADQSIRSIKLLDGAITYADGERVPAAFASAVERYRRLFL